MTDTYWYLATPYSKYPLGIEAAYQLAIETRGWLIKNGVRVFSPIVHSHPVAMQCDMDPHDHSIWLPAEEPMRRCASGLILLRAASWEISVGMAAERDEFLRLLKPVVEMDLGNIPAVLLPDNQETLR